MSATTFEIVKQLISEIAGEFSLHLSPYTTAQEIRNWDSLNHMRLIAALEENFGIDLPFEEISPLQNVGDLVALIERKTLC